MFKVKHVKELLKKDHVTVMILKKRKKRWHTTTTTQTHEDVMNTVLEHLADVEGITYTKQPPKNTSNGQTLSYVFSITKSK